MRKMKLSIVALIVATTSYGQSTQCKELATDSVRCENVTKAKNSLCYLHNPFYTKAEKIPAVRCSGTTKSNRNCKNKTKDLSKLCHLHRND